MAKKTKEEQIGRYAQKERDEKAAQKKAQMRAKITSHDNMVRDKIIELESYKDTLDPKAYGYASTVDQIDLKIKELKEVRSDLAVWYNDFNQKMATMNGDDVLTDGFLDNEWEEFIMPKLVPESKPGLQLAPSVPAWKIKQNEKGQKYKEVLEEIKKTPFYSGGEAPPESRTHPQARI